jgi:uncharacterized membrane protein
MTIAGATLSGADRSSRWLLFASLALNLFFIGIGGALLVRGTGIGTPTEVAPIDRSVGGRVARIAATLPREDGDKLRAAYQAYRLELDDTNTAYRRAQDRVRQTLRAQPFDVSALRTAMTAMQTARQDYDRRLQDFFARLAADISPTGRQKLADWRNSRRETTPAQPANDGGR